MNWASISYDWNQVRAFLATVEEGSFSAAARVLGLTQPTLGRQVAGLEESLGVVLFDRAGKSLRLTPTGEDLLDHVRAMRDAAARVSLAASGKSQAIEGHVVISASDGLSTYVLPEVLTRLRALAPGITVELLVSNRLSDLGLREADIAIRHVRPTQPDLIARLVRESEARFYASRAWVARNGHPVTAEEAAEKEFVLFGAREEFVRQMALIGLDLGRATFNVGTEHGVTYWELVRAGHGIGVMTADFADRYDDVERVLENLPAIPIPYWLTTHRELQTSRRLRVVFDLLAEALGSGGDF